MKSSIALNANTPIDLAKLIDSRLLVQANSGGGKSWLLRRLLEESHGKVQQIVIDLEGEFATLREKYDYLLCGKGGDVPASPKTAGLLARKILELNVSAIIDLYELPHQERKRFVRLFLESMVNAPKELWHSCIVVIDEAHVFVPEKGDSEAADAVIDLATRGRKRGYCAVLATQRLSKLHKDAAAECNNKLIGRTGLDIDMKRAAEELGFTSKEQYLSLRKLEPGDFYAYGPAISSEVVKVTVGEVQTTHPKAGSRNLVSSIPPSDSIKVALKNLIDLPQVAEKEAQTAVELRQEMAQLRRELAVAKRTPGAPAIKIERIEVPAVGKRALEGLKLAEGNMRKLAKAIKESAASVDASVSKLSAELAKISASQPNGTYREFGTFVGGGSTPKGTVIATGRVPKPAPPHEEGDEALTGPEQRVLDALAWCESIGKTKPSNQLLAFLSGYSHFRSTGYTNPRGYLKTKGLIEYSAGSVCLTDAGRALAVIPESPLTQDALQQAVLEKLDNPEKKVLKPLLEKYPEGISNTDLCAMAGYQHERSTGYTNPRGRLKSFGLIEYLPGGMVVAEEILFLP